MPPARNQQGKRHQDPPPSRGDQVRAIARALRKNADDLDRQASRIPTARQIARILRASAASMDGFAAAADEMTDLRCRDCGRDVLITEVDRPRDPEEDPDAD